MAGRTGGGAGDAALNSSGGQAERFSVWLGAAPAAVLTHSTHPGGVGAPPGDTTIPRQELADVDLRSFAVADARLWNGADTVARSPRRLKARSNRISAKRAARRRRCGSQLPTGSVQAELAENAAMERRKAQPASAMAGHPSWMDPIARRVTGRVRQSRQRRPALHPPRFFKGATHQGAARAPRQAGGGALANASPALRFAPCGLQSHRHRERFST